jgi:hypothetical protein
MRDREEAAMKKTYTVVTFVLALLFSAATGTLFAKLAIANPYEAYTYTAPPIISIYSPVNSETFSPNILINFTITRPDEGWLISWTVSGRPDILFKSMLNSVDVTLDGKLYRSIKANSNLTFPFSYSENLTNLSGGLHNLAIQTKCEGWDLEAHGFWERKLPYETSSDLINFTVDATSPTISIFSVENKTYRTPEVALNFTVNEAVAQISYVLDGQDNVTISGNTTLTGLTDGKHNVTFYAKDLVGNIGASETVTFSIEVPFPTATVAAASGASVAIIGIGLLVYFKKRKR